MRRGRGEMVEGGGEEGGSGKMSVFLKAFIVVRACGIVRYVYVRNVVHDYPERLS